MRTIKDLCPQFESKADAINRLDSYRHTLGWSGEKNSKRVRCLRRHLRKCREGDPCGLAFCPVCVRALRMSYIPAVVTCIEGIRSNAKAHGLSIPITSFSAIPTNARYRAPIGAVHRLDFHKSNAAVQRSLQRLGFPAVFAGLDLSLNEDSNERWAPYWQLHTYGVVVGASAQKVRGALERLYPADGLAPRPLVVNRCRDLAPASSYTIKPYFSRRISYVDKSGRRNIRTCHLRNHQLREIALFLSRYSIKDRYILVGCRRSKKGITINIPAHDKMVSR